MQLSDLISIVGVLLAIIAFINENERLFIWNKFSKTDIILIIVSFAFIHYLLFFEWFKGNLSVLKTFSFSNFPSPNTWAYLVSLGLLIWILYKIFIAGFPKVNNTKVLEFYDFLLNKKEYDLFFNLIKKYNFTSLVSKNAQTREDKSILVNLIFSNKRFLESTAEYNFDFFHSIINSQTIQEELIENYIESQILNENSFFNSLNISNDRIKQLSLIISRVDTMALLINQIFNKSKLNYKSILQLIFEYYKIDKHKSDSHIIESWKSLVKSNDANALRLFTNMMVTEKIPTENFIEIVKKITTILSQIELPNDSVFFNETFCSYFTILNKCYEFDANFSEETITKITKGSNNKLPEKLYYFYFNTYDSKNRNLNNLLNSIANE